MQQAWEIWEVEKRKLFRNIEGTYALKRPRLQQKDNIKLNFNNSLGECMRIYFIHDLYQ